MADNDTQKDAQVQDTQDQGEQKKDADKTSQASQDDAGKSSQESVKKAPARKTTPRKKTQKTVKVTGLASTTYMKKGVTAVVEDTPTIQKMAQKGWVKVEDHDG